MSESVQIFSEEPAPETTGTPCVTLMGVGKGGISIVSKINLPDIPLTRIAADTSRSDLESVPSEICRKLCLGEKSLRGFGAGLRAKSGEKAAKESEKQIAAELAGTDLLLLVTALGHGTGSGASPEIAKIAQSLGITVVCFATNPFSDEGKVFTEQAAEAVGKLSNLCNAFVLVDNDVVAQVTAGNQKFEDIYDTGRTWIERGVAVCCSMIFSAKTETRLDFSSFKSIFPVAGTRTLFAVGNGKGENAVGDALETLFRCPLLQTGRAAIHADTLAIRVCAGSAPSMQQMEEISKCIQERFGGEERTLSNFAVFPEMEDEIAINVIGADDVQLTQRRRERTVPAPGNGKSVLAPSFSNPDDEEDELTFSDAGHGKKQLYEGVDLDTPTYRRKRIKLQDELDAWRRRRKSASNA